MDDKEDHFDYSSSLPCRKLQVSLPDRCHHDTFWTAQDSSSAKPLSKAQVQMMTKMISSRTTIRTSKDINKVDFDEYDDMYSHIAHVGPSTGKPFGKELRALCDLYRNKSQLSSSSHLAHLLDSLLRDSSVQAAFPFEAIPIIEKLLEGLDSPEALDTFPSRLTPHCKFTLSQCVGGAGMVPLLIQVSDLISKDEGNAAASDSVDGLVPASRSDCKVVLDFVLYVSDNVKLSFKPDMRIRLLKIAREGKPVSNVYTQAEHEAFTGSSESRLTASSSDDLYDVDGFFRKGSHYPSWHVGCQRGYYTKVDTKQGEKRKVAAGESSRADDDSETAGNSQSDGGCAKDFPVGRGKTGKNKRG